MSLNEWIGGGPMFLTIKNVRRETLLRELKENLLEMVSDNVIRINGVQFSNLNHLILCSFSHTHSCKSVPEFHEFPQCRIYS